MVAEKFAASEHGENNGQKKVNHTEPSKENIEKSECEIYDGPYP